MALTRAQIGSYTFIKLEGSVVGFTEAMEDITRPGVDGVAIRYQGQRAPEFEMISEADVSSKSGVATLMALYRALVGTLVTVKDDLGNSHTYIAVKGVQQEFEVPITSASGGINSNPAALLRCRWRLQSTVA